MNQETVPPNKYTPDINTFYQNANKPTNFYDSRDYVPSYSFYYDDRKKPTYFQKDYPVTVIAPWLGVNAERTYMNRVKYDSDPKVLTYRDIKLLDQPPEDFDNDKDQPYDYTVEFFSGGKQYKEKISICVSVILIMFLLLWSVAEN